MKKTLIGFAFLAGLLSFMSCNEIEIQSPPGPAGPAGIPGPEGKDAYQVWVDAVNANEIDWDKAHLDRPNFFKYLQGEPGASAYDTWVEYIASDTIPNPRDTTAMWPSTRNTKADFFDFLSGAKGEDGMMPTISDDGFWMIGDSVTLVRAQADSVYVGDDGFWYINDENTDVAATGESAYEMWTAELEARQITDPAGNPWPQNQNTVTDFWLYIKGQNPDGTVPAVERTSLSFVEMERSDTVELFTFQTDSGAVVTMNHGDIVRTGTADDTGMVQIGFPNSETREYYAVVTAQSEGKLVSYPLSVRIPIQAPSYDMVIDYPSTTWYDKNGDELDNASGDYGGYDTQIIVAGDTIEYLMLDPATTGFVRIPFMTENITKVTISHSSGASLFYASAIPDAAGDYSTGYLEIRPINDFNPDATDDSYFDIVAKTNTDRAVITIRLRAKYTTP